MDMELITFSPQGYYNDSYYQDPNSGLAEAEEPGQSAMFDDEGVRRQWCIFCIVFFFFFYLTPNFIGM